MNFLEPATGGVLKTSQYSQESWKPATLFKKMTPRQVFSSE